MRKVIIISTKNPTEILLENIKRYREFYKDFDIIIIDSKSTNKEIFYQISQDVKIDYAENENYVLGAWKYAINKYDYDLYLFVQDTLVPLYRIEGIDIIKDFTNIIYDIPYYAPLGYSNNNMNLKDLERLRETYRNTKFSFISDIKEDMIICGGAHTSFLANKENSKKIIELEDVYKERQIKKEKIDCNFSERTIGIMADYLRLNRLIMTYYFHKINGGRKWKWILKLYEIEYENKYENEYETYMKYNMKLNIKLIWNWILNLYEIKYEIYIKLIWN